MSDMTLREAQADAWEQGEHQCQKTGHSFPRSRDTNEPLACSGCGMDPDLYEEDQDEVVVCGEIGHGYHFAGAGCRDCAEEAAKVQRCKVEGCTSPKAPAVPHDNCLYAGHARGHSATHCTASACF